MKYHYTKHGPFNITSGTMIISDPCYDECDNKNNGLLNVLKGNWFCLLEQDEDIKNLYIVHETMLDPKLKENSEIIHLVGNIEYYFQYKTEFDASVDSGQIGCYDAQYFHLCHEELYDTICDLVDASNEGVAILGFGTVSYTLDGDGSYTCLYAKNKEGISGIKIILGQDETENEWNEYDF